MCLVRPDLVLIGIESVCLLGGNLRRRRRRGRSRTSCALLQLFDLGTTVLKLQPWIRSSVESASGARSRTEGEQKAHPDLDFSWCHVEFGRELLAQRQIRLRRASKVMLEDAQLRRRRAPPMLDPERIVERLSKVGGRSSRGVGRGRARPGVCAGAAPATRARGRIARHRNSDWSRSCSRRITRALIVRCR